MKLIFKEDYYNEKNGERVRRGGVEYEVNVATSLGEDYHVRIHDMPIGWGVAVPKGLDGKLYIIKNEGALKKEMGR